MRARGLRGPAQGVQGPGAGAVEVGMGCTWYGRSTCGQTLRRGNCRGRCRARGRHFRGGCRRRRGRLGSSQMERGLRAQSGTGHLCGDGQLGSGKESAAPAQGPGGSGRGEAALLSCLTGISAAFLTVPNQPREAHARTVHAPPRPSCQPRCPAAVPATRWLHPRGQQPPAWLDR